MASRFGKASFVASCDKKILLICRSSCLPASSLECDEQPIGAHSLEIRLQNWLDRNLIDPDKLVIVKVDADGLSSCTFDALTVALRSGTYGLLLVEGLDRISRNFEVVQQLLELAAALQVQIVAIENETDFSG